jgi:hypothetical protein
MADLKCTISDSDSEPSQPRKREEKAERKKKTSESTNDDEAPMDAGFSLIDDSYKKDVSKIMKKKEYDQTAGAGNKWNYTSSVTEDRS